MLVNSAAALAVTYPTIRFKFVLYDDSLVYTNHCTRNLSNVPQLFNSWVDHIAMGSRCLPLTTLSLALNDMARRDTSSDKLVPHLRFHLVLSFLELSETTAAREQWKILEKFRSDHGDPIKNELVSGWRADLSMHYSELFDS